MPICEQQFVMERPTGYEHCNFSLSDSSIFVRVGNSYAGIPGNSSHGSRRAIIKWPGTRRSLYVPVDCGLYYADRMGHAAHAKLARRITILAAFAGFVMLIPSVSAAAVDFRWSLVAGGLGIIVRMIVVWYLWQTPVAEQFSKLFAKRSKGD